MRRHIPPAMAMVGVILSVAACRQDAALAPEGESHTMRSAAAQCLAPEGGRATADAGVVRSRIASVFLGRSPTRQITGSRGDGVVCLSDEQGRWRLRRQALDETGMEGREP
jgi:hypothetical protein